MTNNEIIELTKTIEKINKEFDELIERLDDNKDDVYLEDINQVADLFIKND